MVKLLAFIRFLWHNFRLGFKIRKLSFLGRNVSLSIGKKAILEIAGKVRFDDFTELISEGSCLIGNHVSLNKYSRIIAKDSITIGNDVTIAQFVSILDHDHDIEEVFKGNFQKYVTAPIKIGNNVWIGDKVTVLKGVTIGNNVVIGANSVVNKDIPSNTIAAGIPCKVIKQL